MFRVVNCASTCANHTSGSVGQKGRSCTLTAARVVVVVVRAVAAAFASASAMYHVRLTKCRVPISLAEARTTNKRPRETRRREDNVRSRTQRVTPKGISRSPIVNNHAANMQHAYSM